MDTLDCCNYDEESERLMIPSWLNPDWFTSIKTLIKLTQIGDFCFNEGKTVEI